MSSHPNICKQTERLEVLLSSETSKKPVSVQKMGSNKRDAVQRKRDTASPHNLKLQKAPCSNLLPAIGNGTISNPQSKNTSVPAEVRKGIEIVIEYEGASRLSPEDLDLLISDLNKTPGKKTKVTIEQTG